MRREYTGAELELFKGLADIGSIEYRDEPVKLRSGRKSRVYVHLRGELTEHSNVLPLVGRVLLKAAQKAKASEGDGRPCRFIGIPMAGVALAQAAAFARTENGDPPLPFALMRQVRKRGRGANPERLVEAEYMPKKYRDVFVENVITTGQTILDLAAELEADRFPAKEAQYVFFVDRGQGGMERLRKAGYRRITAVYKLGDILSAFGELGFWPADKVRAALDDLRNG